MVAKAQPDGYTLLFTSPSAITVAEHFPQKMDFEPAQDFRPVAIGLFQPVLLIVRPGLGIKTVDEFVAFARNNPGKISFGFQGLGGEMHLSLELFKKTAGINVTPVPYNAAAQAIVDLLADRLDAMFLVIPPIKQHVEAGKLLALATLAAKRVEAMQSVPTMTELGRPEMTNAIWFGYLAPSKTPDAIVEQARPRLRPPAVRRGLDEAGHRDGRGAECRWSRRIRQDHREEPARIRQDRRRGQSRNTELKSAGRGGNRRAKRSYPGGNE